MAAALLAGCLAGCGASDRPAELTEGAALPPGAAAMLVNRVWTNAGRAAELPGVMRIFLGDGTLVQDSCWETHRLSRWQAEPGGVLHWQEDGIDIRAVVAVLTATELVLRLQLTDGPKEERYVAATVPYVCPDVPR